MCIRDSVGSKGTFGGTLVSQSLLASLHTVPLNFFPTSLHSYFIKGGDPRAKITYHVQNLSLIHIWLMSVLQHQVQNSQTSSLSPSATARTLSTIASSSCFSRNVTRSSTEKSELANMKDASESINSCLLYTSRCV